MYIVIPWTGKQPEESNLKDKTQNNGINHKVNRKIMNKTSNTNNHMNNNISVNCDSLDRKQPEESNLKDNTNNPPEQPLQRETETC